MKVAMAEILRQASAYDKKNAMMKKINGGKISDKIQV